MPIYVAIGDGEYSSWSVALYAVPDGMTLDEVQRYCRKTNITLEHAFTGEILIGDVEGFEPWLSGSDPIMPHALALFPVPVLRAALDKFHRDDSWFVKDVPREPTPPKQPRIVVASMPTGLTPEQRRNMLADRGKAVANLPGGYEYEHRLWEAELARRNRALEDHLQQARYVEQAIALREEGGNT